MDDPLLIKRRKRAVIGYMGTLYICPNCIDLEIAAPYVDELRDGDIPDGERCVKCNAEIKNGTQPTQS
jgi:predicted RNA-binding Zn-ribbon protein involved in translation (DUF1610 family)